MRTSTVPSVGRGRTSHQIFVMASIEPAALYSSTAPSRSRQSAKVRGIPERGMASNTRTRADLSPLSMPRQKGSFVESTSTSGRNARSWFVTWMASSADPTATWTCWPKTSSRLIGNRISRMSCS